MGVTRHELVSHGALVRMDEGPPDAAHEGRLREDTKVAKCGHQGDLDNTLDELSRLDRHVIPEQRLASTQASACLALRHASEIHGMDMRAIPRSLVGSCSCC